MNARADRRIFFEFEAPELMLISRMSINMLRDSLFRPSSQSRHPSVPRERLLKVSRPFSFLQRQRQAIGEDSGVVCPRSRFTRPRSTVSMVWSPGIGVPPNKTSMRNWLIVISKSGLNTNSFDNISVPRAQN